MVGHKWKQVTQYVPSHFISRAFCPKAPLICKVIRVAIFFFVSFWVKMSAIFTEQPPFNRLNLFINQIKNDPPLHMRMNLSGRSEIHRKMESICYVRWVNEKLILNYSWLKNRLL